MGKHVYTHIDIAMNLSEVMPFNTWHMVKQIMKAPFGFSSVMFCGEDSNRLGGVSPRSESADLGIWWTNPQSCRTKKGPVRFMAPATFGILAFLGSPQLTMIPIHTHV